MPRPHKSQSVQGYQNSVDHLVIMALFTFLQPIYVRIRNSNFPAIFNWFQDVFLLLPKEIKKKLES
jgi:hypothetical protein